MDIVKKLTTSALAAARKNYPNANDAKGEILDNHTKKSIEANCRRFGEWFKSDGRFTMRELFSTNPEINKAKEIIQAYQVYLATVYRKTNGECLSPNTVHTYLAYICTALGVSMSEIEKDKRTAGSIMRSRRMREGQNRRGDTEAQLPRFTRLVQFQMAVGLRRSELAQLTPEDLVLDESGYLCVRVNRGKGGKKQLQRILLRDIDITLVAATMLADGSDGKVFSDREMDNNIDLHSMRAAHAFDCYSYYRNCLENKPGYRTQLRSELLDRYDASNPNGSKKHRQKFLKSITNSTPYRLRRSGGNYSTAIKKGRPVAYDRLALMAVSVLHLSHWRVDVTVTNYILGGH